MKIYAHPITVCNSAYTFLSTLPSVRLVELDGFRNSDVSDFNLFTIGIIEANSLVNVFTDEIEYSAVYWLQYIHRLGMFESRMLSRAQCDAPGVAEGVRGRQ